METIEPYRDQISNRFPVASFAIRLPEPRWFEVACATDPRLFHTDHRRHRTPTNFYASRAEGLMRGPAGETTWFIPPSQLKRFAGAERVYVALGTYGSPEGADGRFSISPTMLDAAKSVSLSPDFDGRSLDRGRLGTGASSYGLGSSGGSRYGAPDQELVWGGDAALEAERSDETQRAPYDDGFDAALWESGAEDGYREEAGSAMDVADETGEAAALSHDGALGEEEPWAEPPTAMDVADETGEAAAMDAGEEELWAPPTAMDVADETGEAAALGDAEDPGPPAALDIADETDEAAALGDEEPWAESSAADDESGWAEPTAFEAPAEREWPDASAAEVSPEEEPVYGSVSEGRHQDYAEAESEAFATHTSPRRPINLADKIDILRKIARAESGDPPSFSAINPDREYNDPHHSAYHKTHIGLSWGYLQFTQRGGLLGKVLLRAEERERRLREAGQLRSGESLNEVFEGHWSALRATVTAHDPEARVAPVGGAALWEPAWTRRFVRAGGIDYFQASQQQVGVEDVFDPQMAFARWLGLDSPVALALVVDRAVHMGAGGGRRFVIDAVGPFGNEARRDEALAALGVASVRQLQEQTPGLGRDGQWGPSSHAALVSAVRARGLSSRFGVLDRQAMCERILAAARARSSGLGRRVERLMRDLDSNLTLELP